MGRRWILGAVVGVIALVIVAVIIVPSSYNFNDLKPKLAQAVKEATGRELKLGGDVGLKIGLEPSLVVEQVSFQNASWGSRPELATIRRVEVKVALLPLLRRKIEVKRLVLEEPDILVETDNAGKLNLDFATTNEADPAQPAARGASSSPKLAGLTFDQVSIEKGRFSYRDGRAGKTYALALEKLSVSAKSADSPVQVNFKGAFNEVPFEVAGTVGSLLALSAPAGAWPLKLTGKAGGATLSAEGEIKNDLQGRSSTINLEGQTASIPDLARLAGIAGVPEVGPMRLKGRVIAQGDNLSIEKIEVEAGTEDLAKLKLAGAVKEPLAQRGVGIDFELRGKDLAKVAQLTGRSLPLGGAFEISGRAVDSVDQTYKISELKVLLGESDLGGVLEVSVAGKRPTVNGSLSSKKLDLRPFVPMGEKKAGEGGKSSEPRVRRDRVFSTDAIAMGALKNADATLRIQAGHIFTPRLALSDLTVNIALEDGALSLKPFKAKVGGGALDAQLNLAPKGKTLGLEAAVKINGLDLGRVARDLAVSEKLDGNLDLDLNVRGLGGSVADLMAGLNGKILLVSGNMRIDNHYLELLGADISGSALRLLNPLGRDDKTTEVNCMVSGFDIRNGIAQSTALVFDTKHMTVVGEGTVNLKTEQLDIALKPSPKEGVGISSIAKVGLSPGELAKALKLSGTIARPTLAIDPTQSAVALGKAVGGMALFGPAGIAAALASGSSGDGNPCLAAIEAAKKGVKPAKQGVVESTTQGAKGAVEGAGGKLKKMFGR